MSLMKLKKIIVASLFFVLFFGCVNTYAQTYDSIDARKEQNDKIITSSNNMTSIYRDSYLDLSLKELSEANYTALTVDQQQKLKDLANITILENNGNSLTKEEKLEKFYDWILNNYYYYETPEKITGLSFNKRCDNPYYLMIYEYEIYGKVRARDNGYAATLIALARTQNIPARIVAGYYNKDVRDEYSEWGYDVVDKEINHVWVEAYINDSWKMYDPTADSYNEYDENTGNYISSTETSSEEVTEPEEINNNEDNNTLSEEPTRSLEKTIDENSEEEPEENTTEIQKRYFDPSLEDLSKTHIAFKTYSGSNNIKYISNSTERAVLQAFLNISSNGKPNGKKINSSYNVNNSATWFVKDDTNSITNGYGKVKKIYWPSKKSLTGKLSINSFSALDNLSVPDNKLTSVSITNSSVLRRVNINNNEATKIVITGSKKLVLLKAAKNPAKYIEYNFGTNKQKAILKAGTGGTVSVFYAKASNGYKHYLKAKPNAEYDFVGWYKGNKKVSKKANYTIVKGSSFTYVAKFKKKPPAPYIKVSISKQKLWYYKYGKLQYTSYVVTGQKYSHDTPTGIFKIRGKAREIYLIGPDYKSFVNYWMPIYGDIGLHDATWRWTFGGDIYTYNGSHGCINLPFKTAKYIFNNVHVGTTVKVVS